MFVYIYIQVVSLLFGEKNQRTVRIIFLIQRRFDHFAMKIINCATFFWASSAEISADVLYSEG